MSDSDVVQKSDSTWARRGSVALLLAGVLLIGAGAAVVVSRSGATGAAQASQKFIKLSSSRELVAVSPECHNEFNKAFGKAAASVVKLATAAVLACLGGAETPACKTAKTNAANADQKNIDDCVAEPSTDVYTAFKTPKPGAAASESAVCLPKVCQDEVPAFQADFAKTACLGVAGCTVVVKAGAASQIMSSAVGLIAVMVFGANF